MTHIFLQYHRENKREERDMGPALESDDYFSMRLFSHLLNARTKMDYSARGK